MTAERSNPNDFRLPGITHRTGIFGRTGTGKTRLGAFLLSMSPFDQIPYCVLDYKLEQLFSQVDRIKEIGLSDKLPKQPGLYIVRPDSTENAEVEAWLWDVKKRGNFGLYIDEGYGIDRFSQAMLAILTQGRSLHVPVVWLSQRPTRIHTHAVSELDFIAAFQLTLPQDVQKLAEIMGRDEAEISQHLPEYHSRWYDVAKARSFQMAPVPGDDDILNRFDMRLAPKRRFG